jgi:hypothetical protein
MMPVEWPIASPATEGDGRARVARRGRLSTVRRDFFLDPAKRLTEQERALMTAMLHGLVSDVADAIRAALPTGRVAANDVGDAALIGELTSSGLLDEAGLMRLLLRRADEERISTAAKARSGRRDSRILQGLVSSDHGAVAAAAMALILGRGRRRGRFGESLLALDDLPLASAEHFVHTVAAALRGDLARARGMPAADQELAEASRQVLERYDEQRGVDALTGSLVQSLEGSGGLTDQLILGAAHEGEIAFVSEVVARRARVPGDAALDELLSGESRSVIGLLRMARISRDLCAGLLAAVGDLLGLDDAGAAIAQFDALTDDQAEAERAWLLTSPAYRAALESLGQGRG